jgi:hypothetical protein
MNSSDLIDFMACRYSQLQVNDSARLLSVEIPDGMSNALAKGDRIERVASVVSPQAIDSHARHTIQKQVLGGSSIQECAAFLCGVGTEEGGFQFVKVN